MKQFVVILVMLLLYCEQKNTINVFTVHIPKLISSQGNQSPDSIPPGTNDMLLPGSSVVKHQLITPHCTGYTHSSKYSLNEFSKRLRFRHLLVGQLFTRCSSCFDLTTIVLRAHFLGE